MPCSLPEFFAAIGINPAERNLPVDLLHGGQYGIETYRIVPNNSDGWGCDLVLFVVENKDHSDPKVIRAEVWVSRTSYSGREAGNVYIMQDSEYHVRTMVDFMSNAAKSPPEAQRNN